MARPLGSPNKRGAQLINKLERDHNFNIVGKIVRLYEDTEKLYQPLFLKVTDIMSKNIPIKATYDSELSLWSEGLLPEEYDLFCRSKSELWNMLSKLLGYAYPKLRALEVQTGETDKIIFNISVPKGVSGGVNLEQITMKSSQAEGTDDEERYH